MLNGKYEHIIWDWNGTLLDDTWLCVDIMNGMLQQRQLPIMTVDYYTQIVEFPIIEYYRKLGFDFSREPFSVVAAEFINEYERRKCECQLRVGAVETLQMNIDSGITQSILSASRQSYLDDVVEKFDLNEMFIGINGLDDHYAAGKIDIGQLWMSNMIISADRVLMIGDTDHDYEVAQALGIECILITGGHQNQQRLAACGVPVIESFDEII
ncbi:HAD family hydrolase [candidate division KSB1 bacterium]|nr:HAD family hydrolase [candidate division KSB1 bacterium]